MADTFCTGLPETFFQMTPTDQSGHDTEICLSLKKHESQEVKFEHIIHERALCIYVDINTMLFKRVMFYHILQYNKNT
jgi:hypothetical protein